MYKKLVLMFLLVLMPTIIVAGLIGDAKEAARVKGKAAITGAVEGTPALRIKWTGSGVAATVVCTVTTGDLWFRTDGTIPDSTVGIPTLNGLIDVSNASGNTFLEVWANINASDNWQCQLLGVLPTHVSTATLDSVAATTDVTNAEGYEFLSSTAVEYDGTDFSGVGLAISGSYFAGKNVWVKERNFFNTLYRITYNLTYASGVTVLNIYAVDDVTGTLVAQFPAAATTVEKDIHFYGNELLTTQRGKRLVVFPSGDAALTAGACNITGISYNEHDIGDGMR